MSSSEASALHELRVGERATVVAVDAGPSTGARLLALGFAPGTPVHAVRRAPLGDPTEYEVRGARIALRSSEAALIRVQRDIR
jgi:Fe2+ transport system protein FeoA